MGIYGVGEYKYSGIWEYGYVQRDYGYRQLGIEETVLVAIAIESVTCMYNVGLLLPNMVPFVTSIIDTLLQYTAGLSFLPY